MIRGVKKYMISLDTCFLNMGLITTIIFIEILVGINSYYLDFVFIPIIVWVLGAFFLIYLVVCEHKTYSNVQEIIVHLSSTGRHEGLCDALLEGFIKFGAGMPPRGFYGSDIIILLKVLYVQKAERKREVVDRPIFDAGTDREAVQNGAESAVYRFLCSLVAVRQTQTRRYFIVYVVIRSRRQFPRIFVVGFSEYRIELRKRIEVVVKACGYVQRFQHLIARTHVQRRRQIRVERFTVNDSEVAAEHSFGVFHFVFHIGMELELR